MPKFAGVLYRALNPIWAREPMSGAGAARFGGRFNAQGLPALYTALSPDTAIREANQVGHLQPTTLVSYVCEIERVFDTRDVTAMANCNVDLGAPSWRDEMMTRGTSHTQDFAADLISQGYSGLIVPSFVRGAGAHDMNLVLWAWSDASPAKLTLIDDENRLGQGRPDP